MSKGTEREIIDECRKRLKRSRADGVVLDLYEFKDTAGVDVRKGQFFQTTSISRFACDPVSGITLKGDNKGCDGKFWIQDLSNKSELEEMIRRSLKLKHQTILKPLLCNESEDLSKMVAACAVYSETFVEWAAKHQGKVRGDYLSDEEKSMLSSLWNVAEEIWNEGYTSDLLTQPSSYVIVSQRIKLLPFVIRDQKDGDTEMALRTQLANLLEINISPLWNNPELDEFISLVKNPNARSKHILGHPILLNPVQRQAMYRPMCSSRMSKEQREILKRKVIINANWNQLAQTDTILKSILHGNMPFSLDSEGACHLARIVSCHYTQHMRIKDKQWYEHLKEDTVDKWLKTNMSLLLCKRYALICDPEFVAAGELT